VNVFNYKNLEKYRNLPDRLMIGVSGGRSSAYQMAHIVEANPIRSKDWVFVFENTGLERPETYDFIYQLDQYFDLNLVILEYNPEAEYKFDIVDYNNISKQGQPMVRLLSENIVRRDGSVGVRPLPNPAQRTCTANLKIKTAHRYVRKHLKWPTQYYAALGYRADEKSRCDRKWLLDEKRGFSEGGIGIFPMFDAGVTADDVSKFWYSGPFDLQLDNDFGNCDFCFMASTWKIKQRMILVALESQVKLQKGAIPPERIMRWILWEERISDRPGPFRKDRPNMRQLWEQVCEGNYESAVPEGRDDQCGFCTD